GGPVSSLHVSRCSGVNTARTLSSVDFQEEAPRFGPFLGLPSGGQFSHGGEYASCSSTRILSFCLAVKLRACTKSGSENPYGPRCCTCNTICLKRLACSGLSNSATGFSEARASSSDFVRRSS